MLVETFINASKFISVIKIFLNASAGHWKFCGGPHVVRRPLIAHLCPKKSLEKMLYHTRDSNCDK